MRVFYRNSSVLGFQWDESEVIRGLPVQRRVPEVFEMAVYEKRDIYTGVEVLCTLLNSVHSELFWNLQMYACNLCSFPSPQ